MMTKAAKQTDNPEKHRSGRSGWLCAAVLGSDDAIVWTASLMIGVAASSASKEAVLIAGVAGLVAGAMSMAVGEYVSVSSKRDAEEADSCGASGPAACVCCAVPATMASRAGSGLTTIAMPGDSFSHLRSSIDQHHGSPIGRCAWRSSLSCGCLCKPPCG